MFTLTITDDRKESLRINDLKVYATIKAEGMSGMSARVNTDAIPTADVHEINGSYADLRNIVLTIKVLTDIEENRTRLYRYFRIKHDINLRYVCGDRDLCIGGIVESIDFNPWTKDVQAQVSILCKQPYWEDAQVMISDISRLEKLFEFPFCIDLEEPKEFARLKDDIVQTVYNTGDVDTGIIVILRSAGTVKNPEVYAVDERKTMYINMTMKHGDEIIINTKPGEKSVKLTRDGKTRNIIHLLRKDQNAKKSNWFVLKSGENRFAYMAETGSEFLEVQIKHANRYQGV